MTPLEQIVHDSAAWMESSGESSKEVWQRIGVEKRKWFENFADFHERVNERVGLMNL